MATTDRRGGIAAAVVTLLACGACGGGSPPEPGGPGDLLTARTLGPQTVLSVSEYLAQAPYAEADDEYGDRISMQCRACHTFEKGGPNMIGPNLHGFFGRPAGSAPGFPYSRAFESVNFVWTPRALDAWLAEPSQFLPGNAMAYPGLANASDRVALIASLLRQTSREQPQDE